MKGPIQSVSISCLVHATEDENLVESSIARLLAAGAEPERQELEGHYGNAIRRVEFRLTGEAAERALSKILHDMSGRSRKELLEHIAEHVDEHSALFLRLDKQRLVSGEVSLIETDPVRVKVKPRAFLVKGSGPKFYAGLIAKEG